MVRIGQIGNCKSLLFFCIIDSVCLGNITPDYGFVNQSTEVRKDVCEKESSSTFLISLIRLSVAHNMVWIHEWSHQKLVCFSIVFVSVQCLAVHGLQFPMVKIIFVLLSKIFFFFRLTQMISQLTWEKTVSHPCC